MCNVTMANIECRAYEFSTRSLIPLPNFRRSGRSVIWVERDRAVIEVSAIGRNSDDRKHIMDRASGENKK